MTKFATLVGFQAMSQSFSNTAGLSTWWGRHSIPAGRSDFWQIGSLKMWIEHLPFRLALKWTHGPDWADSHLRHLPGTPFEKPQAPHPGVPLSRINEATCAFGNQVSSDVVFSPTLPDRSVIVRTQKPAYVLPGEEITAYLVTPVWVRIELTNPVRLVHEIPTFRLSDTWFGPATTTGELAYASPIELIFDLRDVPLRSHCAVTSVSIHNAGGDSLLVDRLNIPYKRLSLYYSSQTGFWTDRIKLERREDDEMTELTIENQAPPEASPSQFVSGPRQAIAEAGHFRAFSRFFDRSEPG